MADRRIFDLPENIDERILGVVAENRALTAERVVRDIARLHCLLHLVEEGLLGDHAVLTGGMAMRCLNSPRFSVYDSDTSSVPEVSDERLLGALNYSDADLGVSIATINPGDRGKDLVSAHPVEFDPYFTRIAVTDTTFKLTVSNRGVCRSAQWLPLRTGYPFSLWSPEKAYRVPVIATNELLAEKLSAWWIFAPAKHYADIAYLGGLLRHLCANESARADIRELVEIKLSGNSRVSKLHRTRIAALDRPAREDRLLNPEKYLDRERSFDRLAFFGSEPPRADHMKEAVRRWIVPLVFD